MTSWHRHRRHGRYALELRALGIAAMFGLAIMALVSCSGDDVARTVQTLHTVKCAALPEAILGLTLAGKAKAADALAEAVAACSGDGSGDF